MQLSKPGHLGGPQRFKGGVKSEIAHKWGHWLHSPYLLGDPQQFPPGGDNVDSGPQMDGLSAQPMPYGGSPKRESGGQNSAWPTNGRMG